MEIQRVPSGQFFTAIFPSKLPDKFHFRAFLVPPLSGDFPRMLAEHHSPVLSVHLSVTLLYCANIA